MPEFIENPRRTPRVPLRCRVIILSPSGAVQTETEDIGARGCQVVMPTAPTKGDVIALAIAAPTFPRTLRVEGRIAWVSPRAPWRVGVAFVGEALPEAARWMEALFSAQPKLFPARRSPALIAVDAMVYLGAPPRLLLDFGEDELEVLRAVGSGVRVGDLRARLSRSWPRMQRAFFSLLGQLHLTLARSAAGHPATWRRVLGEPERGPAPEPALPVARRQARVPPPPPHGPESAAPTDPGPEPAAPPAPTPPPSSRPLSRATYRDTVAGSPAPDFVGAGVGWRAPTQPRPPLAQALYAQALLDLEEGRTQQALTRLRQALAVAPGDPEIATAIGKAMNTDRSQGS